MAKKLPTFTVELPMLETLKEVQAGLVRLMCDEKAEQKAIKDLGEATELISKARGILYVYAHGKGKI